MVALRVADKAKVLLCGYYGEHNLGDDALLQVLVSQLPDAWHPVITARDHQAVASLVPSASIVNRRSLSETIRALQHVDALVLGGGSLLQDGTSFKSLLYYLILLWSARWNRIPIILWGQGLGPLRRQWSRWCVRATLGRIRAVSWRDPASLHQAQQWRLGMPMVMGPDPVWCHPAPAWSGGQDLILCLRPTPLLNTKGWQMLLQALDHFSAQSRSKVIWLAFHGDQDAALWNDLDQQGLIPAGLRERSLQMRAESLDQVQRLFSKAALVIAMRLHALILAATTGCPTAALSYDPKVKAAAQLANLPWLDLAHPLDVQSMTRQWTDARRDPASTSTIQQLRETADVHRTLLWEHLQMIQRHLE